MHQLPLEASTRLDVNQEEKAIKIGCNFGQIKSIMYLMFSSLNSQDHRHLEAITLKTIAPFEFYLRSLEVELIDRCQPHPLSLHKDIWPFGYHLSHYTESLK